MGDARQLSTEEREELCAYLDEELDAKRTRRLEAKIAKSPTVRREVNLLRRTWEVLDFLPMPEPKEDFTHRTVELSSRQAESKAAPTQAATAKSGGWRVRLALWLLGLAACFALGLIALTAWPDPNRRLVDDLPVLERYDEYRAVGDIEFLKQLHNSGILDRLDEPLAPDPETGNSP